MDVDDRKEVANRRILSLPTKQWNDNSIKVTLLFEIVSEKNSEKNLPQHISPHTYLVKESENSRYTLQK
jgi:hypothetical protein